MFAVLRVSVTAFALCNAETVEGQEESCSGVESLSEAKSGRGLLQATYSESKVTRSDRQMELGPDDALKICVEEEQTGPTKWCKKKFTKLGAKKFCKKCETSNKIGKRCASCNCCATTVVPTTCADKKCEGAAGVAATSCRAQETVNCCVKKTGEIGFKACCDDASTLTVGGVPNAYQGYVTGMSLCKAAQVFTQDCQGCDGENGCAQCMALSLVQNGMSCDDVAALTVAGIPNAYKKHVIQMPRCQAIKCSECMKPSDKNAVAKCYKEMCSTLYGACIGCGRKTKELITSAAKNECVHCMAKQFVSAGMSCSEVAALTIMGVANQYEKSVEQLDECKDDQLTSQ